MSVISTFELLVKPQIQTIPGNPGNINNLGRNIIQGYFLSIANTMSFDVAFSATLFVGASPPVNPGDILTFFDANGVNTPGGVTANPSNTVLTTSQFLLPGNTTGLLLVQPTPARLTTLDFEVRGYVSLTKLSPSTTPVILQVTPEHRGTFFETLGGPPADRLRDQIAYSLPTPNGGVVSL